MTVPFSDKPKVIALLVSLEAFTCAKASRKEPAPPSFVFVTASPSAKAGELTRSVRPLRKHACFTVFPQSPGALI
jgi:hypothetical protein